MLLINDEHRVEVPLLRFVGLEVIRKDLLRPTPTPETPNDLRNSGQIVNPRVVSGVIDKGGTLRPTLGGEVTKP